ncbi:hairy-related 8a [Aplochiton taeniatus]
MTASNMGNGSDKNLNAKVERKLRKPLIEKRRRERINCSLEQLKGIMVEAYNLDQSKLEKADVLEITVQHMDGLQKGHAAAAGSPGPSGAAGFESRQRYSSGYIQCMHEVHNLLLNCQGMDKTLGARLLNHLLKSLPLVGRDAAKGSPGCSALRGGGGGRSGSPLQTGGGPASPPPSPLSLPMGAPFRPRRLLLHLPASPAPKAPAAVGERLRERESRSSCSAPGSPRTPGFVGPGGAPPPPPPAGQGVDPSMWRPW